PPWPSHPRDTSATGLDRRRASARVSRRPAPRSHSAPGDSARETAGPGGPALKTAAEVTEVAHRRRHAALRRVALLLAILALLAATFSRPLFCGNFGVVDPGLAYRCAQPQGNLSRLLDACRPASILNLRGGTPADAWYAAEVLACEGRGIAFYDIPI